MTRWVYAFGDGRAGRLELLGRKGSSLAEMSSLGLPVPPGFTITTEVCSYFFQNSRTYPDDLHGQVAVALADMEASAGARFGASDLPLLLSVRSGAPTSMPGMLDTVLNLGLNDETVAGLAARSRNPRFAFDCYRRFIHMYSTVVLGIDYAEFEDCLGSLKRREGTGLDTDLDADALEHLVHAYKSVVKAATGEEFPQDLQEQLWGAIGAVFGSWMNRRAVAYRSLYNVPASPGTAVSIQAMVFGNMGEDSAAGVACTRNPSTGENRFYGEFMVNTQGEDLVAGIRTPQQLTAAGRAETGCGLPAMEELMPDTFRELDAVRQRLEAHYRDMQDIEFTVQQGRLYMLQTRAGKRTAAAAMRIAFEMAESGIISREDAVLRIRPESLEQLMKPALSPKAIRRVIAAGLPSSQGAASGLVVFTPGEAERLAEQGENVILVRTETSSEDIRGMHAAQGILTARGGRNSHAATVARAMGRPCVSGTGRMRIDGKAGCFHVDDVTVKAGDRITIDGSTGEVMLGTVATTEPSQSQAFTAVMTWADAVRGFDVRAGIRTSAAVESARGLGAQGFGPLDLGDCMGNAGCGIVVESDIALGRVAEGTERLEGLAAWRQGFGTMFRILAGLPVAIRLYRHPEADSSPVRSDGGYAGSDSRGVVTPIARTILEAAAMVRAHGGADVSLELLVPCTIEEAEFSCLKDAIGTVADAVQRETGVKVTYFLGRVADLRIPRACANRVSDFGIDPDDFVRFAIGIGRDESVGLLDLCRQSGIVEINPFACHDGTLTQEIVDGCDSIRITVCETAGRSYISCAPSRVPVVRISAAQAALRSRGS